MEFSSDSDSKPSIQLKRFWFSLSQGGVLLAVAGAGLLVGTSTVFGWWFPNSNFHIPHFNGSLTLTPLHTQTTAFSLEPIVPETMTVVSSVQPTTQPTPVPTVAAKVAPTVVSTAQPTTVASHTNIADQILQLVNNERSSRGLTPLRLSTQLTSAAQKYAVQMQQQGFFSHTAPDGTTFVQRDEAAGYTGWTWLGENIAYGQISVQEVMTSWMNSPEHKANILEPKAQELGVGYTGGSTPCWVQDFGAK